MHSFMSFNSTH